MAIGNAVFDPIFVPIIRFSPLIAVILLSVIISLIMTLIYKYTTNQKRMKELKEKLDGYQKELKESKNDQKRMMAINSDMMKVNAEYMKQSIKPMLVSWIPVILIFGWMSANLAYEPIMPGQDFNATLKFLPGTTGTATISSVPALEIIGSAAQEIQNSRITWNLKGQEGNYTVYFDFRNRTYDKKIIITQGTKYEVPATNLKGDLASIEISNKPLLVINFWFIRMNWFWAYFVLALVLNSVLRKLMHVY
jgi:uncharacterized membrane protein (DUF106 family)